MNYDDAEWAANILLTRVNGFHDIEKLKKAYSFSDLYEITLEPIWKRIKELGKLQSFSRPFNDSWIAKQCVRIL